MSEKQIEKHFIYNDGGSDFCCPYCKEKEIVYDYDLPMDKDYWDWEIYDCPKCKKRFALHYVEDWEKDSYY